MEVRQRHLFKSAFYVLLPPFLTTVHRVQLDARKQYTGEEVFIARYTLEAAKLEPLVEGGTSPAPSPDGQHLVYTGFDPATTTPRLMIAGPDGLKARVLVELQKPFLTIAGPRWSPDSRQLVFTASGGPGTTTSAGISPPRQGLLARIMGVSVAEAHGPPSYLWLVGADGGKLQRLTTRGADDPRAIWSPDGTCIVYSHGDNGAVYLLDLRSKLTRPVANKGDYGGITWAPK